MAETWKPRPAPCATRLHGLCRDHAEPRFPGGETEAPEDWDGDATAWSQWSGPRPGFLPESSPPSLAWSCSWLPSPPWADPASGNRLLPRAVPAETKIPRRREKKNTRRAGWGWGTGRGAGFSSGLETGGAKGHTVSRQTSQGSSRVLALLPTACAARTSPSLSFPIGAMG